MDTTFGGVHFIIDSEGFLRLPSSNASSLRTSAPETIVPLLQKDCLETAAKAEVALVAERSNRRGEGIYAVKKKNEPQVTVDSARRDTTTRSQAKAAAVHLSYLLQSNLMRCAICTPMLTRRVTSRNPLIY
jgi:hypothetical protein